MNRQMIWAYYGEIAAVLNPPVEDKETGEKKPSVFSVEDFFRCNKEPRDIETQTPLLRTFLGDNRAISEKEWNAPLISEGEIEKWLSNDKKPYENQIKAICHSISRPITIIQGPPGTGKTEMILNLLLVIHGLNEGKEVKKTVAVVSSNNEAINNITEKTKETAFSDIQNVYTPLGNRKIRKKWQGNHKELEKCFTENFMFRPDFLKERPLFSSTIHSLRKIFSGKERFDYVIVDECSQVSIELGLVAMGSAAEHLILVGDNEQLQPFINKERKKDVNNVNEKYSERDVPDNLRVADGKSFLAACMEVFGNKTEPILLNKHYRCHPAIIGFCNKYVYDGKLKLKKKGNNFPIRVLWYEGEYCEEDTQGYKNTRQIEVFLKDEWPLLVERLKDNPNVSICVISPYRKPIEDLKKRLEEKLDKEDEETEKINQEIKDLVRDDLKIEDENDDKQFFEKVERLTIHKSQGKGFDIVCFLSVRDDRGASWAQQKRMINVSVSRAKKEFHLITCNQWLPEEFQKEKIGYALPAPDSDKQEDYFLRKLINYTYENMKDNLTDGDFGFHRSRITSVFDPVPRYRLYDVGLSAPEKCMRKFLIDNFSENYKIYREVPLGELYSSEECDDRELKEYIKNGARVDFLICENEDALLAIEVDGAHHRCGKEKENIQKNDELKNKCFELMKNNVMFLRVSTDGGIWENTEGTVESEKEYIRQMIDAARGLASRIKFTNAHHTALNAKLETDKDELMMHYIGFLRNKCLEGLKEYYDEHKELPNIDYSTSKTINDIKYSNLPENQFYFCKYGIAYAFEYAMLYELMLRISDTTKEKKEFGVYSFGCGGYIDAWALAYARAKLKAHEFHIEKKLYYAGIDKKIWKASIFGKRTENKSVEIENPADDTEKKIIPGFEINKLFNKGLENFHPREEGKEGFGYECLKYQVLMFPKILNELNDSDLEKFIENLGKFDYNRKVVYICVSHSPAKMAKGMEAVQKIIGVFKEKGFTVTDDLQEMLGNEQYKSFCKELFCGTPFKDEVFGEIEIVFEDEENNRSKSKGYFIDGKEDSKVLEIKKMNSDFWCKEINNYLWKLSEEGVEDCNQMTRANIAFQIIKLEKKRA